MKAAPKQATRKKILAAAAKLFAKKGFISTTVDDIAKASRVNVAILYYYFRNKETILDEVVKANLTTFRQRFCEMNGKHLKSIIRGESKDCQRKLKKILQELIDFACKNERFARIVLEQTLLNHGKGKTSFFSIYSQVHQLDISAKNIDLILQIFFFHVFPVINFAIFNRQLAKNFRLNPELLKRRFLEEYSHLYMETLERMIGSGQKACFKDSYTNSRKRKS